MAKTITLSAELRQNVGKGDARRLRRLEDRVPAVIYGGREAAQSITLSHHQLMNTLEKGNAYTSILDLELNNASQKVIVKALQRHPYKPRLLHLDFMRIRADEQLTMSIPLHFMGEDKAPGLKQGGLFSKLMTEVSIKCLPADLPEFINVDVSGLEVGSTVHLSDLQLPNGVQLAHAISDEEHNHPVIALHAPRAEEEEKTAGEQPSASAVPTAAELNAAKAAEKGETK